MKMENINFLFRTFFTHHHKPFSSISIPRKPNPPNHISEFISGNIQTSITSTNSVSPQNLKPEEVRERVSRHFMKADFNKIVKESSWVSQNYPKPSSFWPNPLIHNSRLKPFYKNDVYGYKKMTQESDVLDSKNSKHFEDNHNRMFHGETKDIANASPINITNDLNTNLSSISQENREHLHTTINQANLKHNINSKELDELPNQNSQASLNDGFPGLINPHLSKRIDTNEKVSDFIDSTSTHSQVTTPVENGSELNSPDNINQILFNKERLEHLWKYSSSHGISWDKLEEFFFEFLSEKNKYSELWKKNEEDILKFSSEKAQWIIMNKRHKIFHNQGDDLTPLSDENINKLLKPRSLVKKLTRRIYFQYRSKFMNIWSENNLIEFLKAKATEHMLNREEHERFFAPNREEVVIHELGEEKEFVYWYRIDFYD